MDKIQKVLIEQGRKDLAQEYYKKIATKVDFSSFDKNFDKMKASSSFEKSIYFHSGKNRRIELHHKDGKVLKGGGLIMGPGMSRNYVIFDEAPIAQAHKVLISQGYELQKRTINR